MADGEALRRLGGGRWKTADERFTIEPQSGSWVVVDAEQTDDLGLPLVRGPFASLTAARVAIETARTGDVPISPLAARVEEERRHPRPPKPTVAAVRPAASGQGARRTRNVAAERPPEPSAAPPPPPEPAWIRKLPATRQRAARQLIERLSDAGIAQAEDIARAEVADGQPAVARMALERQLGLAIERHRANRDALIADIIRLMAAGEDEQLQVRWRLVDGEERPMSPIPGGGPDD